MCLKETDLKFPIRNKERRVYKKKLNALERKIFPSRELTVTKDIRGRSMGNIITKGEGRLLKNVTVGHLTNYLNSWF